MKLKIKVAVGSENYQFVDTEIEVPDICKNYYLPTDYKNPLQVQLIDYNVVQCIDNLVRVMACVDVSQNLKIELKEVSPNLLFKSKDKASDYYLKHKSKLNWDYLK